MIKPESIFENILFTTVRIEASLPPNNPITGTGFVFKYVKKDKQYLFVVTNKHVIKNSIKGKLTFNQSDGEKPILGKVFTIEYSNFESQWIGHSQDDIDVAIMPFAPVLNELSNRGIQIFFRSVTPDLIPSDKLLREDIDAVEDIVFVGYPCGIYDRGNLLPVVRRGITATPISIDFERKPKFLIDASIFPGSSGSPVFLCNIGSYSPKGKGLLVGSRIFFLGVVASVFIRKDWNTIELIDIPTGKIPVVSTTQMVDLGIVYKSIVIKELIEEFLKTRGEI
ncbi:Trypsin-like peptidase domain-containing protein [Candidatus Methanophagaceae archaeon]|nr:Trypsin-like peptidase domain-containing protein [Methanophagales archaeon]KAF5431742.1 Trypsin-like peptidase domain-containing protein [Methanophagales archaeon]